MPKPEKINERLASEKKILRKQIVALQSLVSSLTLANESLSESNEQLDLFLKYCPVYTFFKDENINVVRLSNNFEALTGKPLDDMIGKDMHELFPHDLAEKIIKDDRNALDEGISITVEEVFSNRVFKTTKFPIIRKGKPSLLAGFTVDITEQKQAEEALRQSQQLLQSTLDGLSANIALLDSQGVIILVNQAWREFALQNGLTPDLVCEGTNYLVACSEASGKNADEAIPFSEGIRKVLSGELDSFLMEYPCHAPNKDRWFVGRVTPFPGEGSRRVIVAHEDITKRKQMEISLADSNRKLAELSITDSLTGLANRRHFNETLSNEYARHARSSGTLSIIMLDIDYFKAFNDTYGHVKGDECLQKIARVISECTERPSDLGARYGGEEFICILPDTNHAGALSVAENIRKRIVNLSIIHSASLVSDEVTCSMGVVTVRCFPGGSVEKVVSQADQLLYLAKFNGRNRIESADADEHFKFIVTEDKHLVQIVWKETYCCGNKVLDTQHKSLFRIANELIESILTPLPHEVISRTIENLINEVALHFHDEETVLRSINFPMVDKHTTEHNRLVAHAKKIAHGFAEGSVSVGDVFQFLAQDVVMIHMLRADKEYFPYIN